jgi:hypothetical protein
LFWNGNIPDKINRGRNSQNVLRQIRRIFEL